jgi:hypothetical protein
VTGIKYNAYAVVFKRENEREEESGGDKQGLWFGGMKERGGRFYRTPFHVTHMRRKVRKFISMVYPLPPRGYCSVLTRVPK